MRIVAVTGASSGVGRAAARRFAAEGFDVGLIARNELALENAKREVEALGRRACIALADVGDPADVEAAAELIERQLGPLDVWVNDAMVSVFGPVRDLTPEEARRVTEVTYLGTVYGTMSALRRMRRRGGVIVQVGSALGYRGIPLQAAYCAAKHAIQGFTESLRCELIHERSPVRVVIVNLPAINTPQFGVVRAKLRRHPRPVAPVYQPELAARAIYEAAVRLRRSELNFGVMSSVAIVGGNLAPAVADRYLAATGYESQQLDEPLPPGRPDNLYAPPGYDPGAHGRFDTEAKSRSPHLWFALHRTGLLLAAAAAAACWAGRRHA